MLLFFCLVRLKKREQREPKFKRPALTLYSVLLSGNSVAVRRPKTSQLD